MKVLLAIDGSRHSEDAIEMISTLDPGIVSEIRILTVIDMALPLAHDIYSGMITNTAEIEKAAREAADHSLSEARDRISKSIGSPAVNITTTTRVGAAESNIVEEAERMDADIIVVGSHGYNRWERLLLGSVSDSVVHHAPCSVLVVRPSGEKN